MSDEERTVTMTLKEDYWAWMEWEAQRYGAPLGDVIASFVAEHLELHRGQLSRDVSTNNP